MELNKDRLAPVLIDYLTQEQIDHLSPKHTDHINPGNNKLDIRFMLA
jgi:hypothetical protein